MLVLTRRLGEKIVINGDIQVKVLAVHGEKVRLGISAPAYVPVHRHEVQERLDAELLEADHARDVPAQV